MGRFVTVVLLLGTGCAGGEFSDGDTFGVVTGECSTDHADSISTPYAVRFSDYVADLAPDGCIGSLEIEFDTCATRGGCPPTRCQMCLRPSGDGYELLSILDPEQVPHSGFCASLDWREGGGSSYVFGGRIVTGRAAVDGEILDIELTADGEGGVRGAPLTPTTMRCFVTAIRE